MVTKKELGYSALKPEQLEVIMPFVGEREVFVVVSRFWVQEKPLLQPNACHNGLYYTADRVIFCGNSPEQFSLSIMHDHDTHATRSYWNRPGTEEVGSCHVM